MSALDQLLQTNYREDTAAAAAAPPAAAPVAAPLAESEVMAAPPLDPGVSGFAAMQGGGPGLAAVPGVISPGSPVIGPGGVNVPATFGVQKPGIETNQALLANAPMDSMIAKDQVRTQATNEELQAGTQKILADQTATAKMRETYDAYLANIRKHDENWQKSAKALEEEKQRTLDNYTQQLAIYSKTKINNWWAEASTPAKILGVISQALSGALAGLKGTPGAPSPLDRIIERDIEIQKANASLEGAKTDDAKGMYQTALTTFKDSFQAYSATKELAYKQASETIDMMAKLSTDEQFQAQIAVLRGQLGKQLAETRTKDLDTITNQLTDAHKFNVSQAMDVNKLAISQQNAESARISAEAQKKTADAQNVDVILTNIPNASPQLRKQVGDAVFSKLVAADQTVHKLQAAIANYASAPNFRARGAAASTMFDVGREESGAGAALSGQEFDNIRAKYPAGTNWLDPRTHINFINDLEEVLKQKVTEITNMTSGFIGADGKPLRYVLNPIPSFQMLDDKDQPIGR